MKTLVISSRWDELIGSSAMTMKKFQLKLDLDDLHSNKVMELQSLRRSHQIIYFNIDESTCSDLAKFVPVFRGIGSQVRSLTIGYSKLANFVALADILQSFPLLESFKVIGVSFLELLFKTLLETYPSALDRLKRFEFVNSDRQVMKYFRGVQATSCSLMTFNTRTFTSPENLTDFLKSSKKLTVLELNDQSFQLAFKSKLEICWKLKKFVYATSFPTQVADKNFITFLKSQSASLEELVLQSVSEEVFLAIFSKLDRLRCLKLTINWKKIERSFFNQLKPNRSLNEMDLILGTFNQILIKGILGNCPELEKLNLTLYNRLTLESTHIVSFMSANNRKIKHLPLLASEPPAESKIKFEFLESLQVENIASLEALLFFLRENPSVHTFKCKSLSKQLIHDEAFDVLMNLPTLKSLKFGVDGNAQSKIREKYARGKKKIEFV